MARAVNAEQFKRSMRHLPTGVTIISTIYNNELFGFTANSFTSVSLEPPLVLFCLKAKSGSINAFRQSNNFAISILAEDQAYISRHFATGMHDKFSSMNYITGKVSGCPLITGATCWIECSKLEEYESGDHFIFIGEVQATKINSELKPLVYFSRSYREIK